MYDKPKRLWCEKKKTEIGFTQCRFLNPAICPYYHGCIIKTVRETITRIQGGKRGGGTISK